MKHVAQLFDELNQPVKPIKERPITTKNIPDTKELQLITRKLELRDKLAEAVVHPITLITVMVIWGVFLCVIF